MTEVQGFLGPIYVWLSWFWSLWQVKFILAHVGINTVVAIAATVYTGEFQLAKTGEFLYRKALPYLMVFAAFAVLGELANLVALTNVAWAALTASLLGDLLDNLHKLGIAIPESLTKREKLAE